MSELDITDVFSVRGDGNSITLHFTEIKSAKAFRDAFPARVVSAEPDIADVEAVGDPSAWLFHSPSHSSHVEIDRIAALSAENERLRKALEFYADRGFDGYDVDVTSYGISMEKGAIIKDGGDIARAALEPKP
jgi:hypothetical protein